MPFSLRYRGETILTVDEQVLGVAIQTARGETATTGIAPNEGVVDIVLNTVAAGGPPRLDQIEMAAVQATRDRAVEGQSVGRVRDFDVEPTRSTQGFHDETLREGGVDRGQEQVFTQGPSVDLAQGLHPSDSETLTARIEAFSDHGDAQRAIKDNQPSGQGFTAEKGATPSGTASDSVSSSDSPPSDVARPVGAPVPEAGEGNSSGSGDANPSGPGSGSSESGDNRDYDTKSATQPDSPAGNPPSTSAAPGIKLPGKSEGSAGKTGGTKAGTKE
jgi:hypothetical protein